MRLPRDLSGTDLAQALGALGYRVTRQTGSHLRLTTFEHGEHHLTVPQHTPSALVRSPQFWPTLLGISRPRETILSHACFVRSDKDGSPLPRGRRSRRRIRRGGVHADTFRASRRLHRPAFRRQRALCGAGRHGPLHRTDAGHRPGDEPVRDHLRPPADGPQRDVLDADLHARQGDPLRGPSQRRDGLRHGACRPVPPAGAGHPDLPAGRRRHVASGHRGVRRTARPRDHDPGKAGFRRGLARPDPGGRSARRESRRFARN